MDNLGVALVNYACPICGKTAESGIIMNSLLTETSKKSVENLHDKTVGYADKCCEECSKYKDEVVFFVGIDSEKSTKQDIYRTGEIAGISRKAPILKQFKDYILTLKDGTKYCFIDEKAGEQIKLWNNGN